MRTARKSVRHRAPTASAAKTSPRWLGGAAVALGAACRIGLFATEIADTDFLLRHLDAEGQAYIEHSPDTPLCARTPGDYWLRNGVVSRGRRMFELYLAHAAQPDPEVGRRLRQLDGR